MDFKKNVNIQLKLSPWILWWLFSYFLYLKCRLDQKRSQKKAKV